MFEDKIEAWSYGPVERDVYFTFQKYGRNRIPKPEGETAKDERTLSVVDRTAKKYGFLTGIRSCGILPSKELRLEERLQERRKRRNHQR